MAFIDKLAWIEIREGKILSTRSRGKDIWYIPGGKRETGETDQEALIREISEELSVRLVPEQLSFLGEWSAQAHGHPEGLEVRMRCYEGPYTGKLEAAAEIAEWGWLAMSDIARISPVDQQIFSYLHSTGRLV
ncbi:MAG: NUDIX domain-containing protein [Bacteroidota bacterium]